MDPATAAILERLGVAGILVIAAYFMLRYFMGQMDKKEQQIELMTKQFIDVAKQFATISERSIATQEAVTESIDRLTNEFRQALGNAIVGAAHEAIKGAKEIAAGRRNGV